VFLWIIKTKDGTISLYFLLFYVHCDVLKAQTGINFKLNKN